MYERQRGIVTDGLGWRRYMAALLLAAIVAVPVLATRWLSTAGVNALTAWLLVAFSVAMLPETGRDLQRLRKQRSFRIVVGIALLCMGAWQFFQGPFTDIPRFWLYLALALFFVSALAWFRPDADASMQWLFVAKLLTTGIAMLIIAAAIATAPDGARVFWHMPVYRHVRHLNYDLVVVIALGLWFWAAARRASWGFLALFIALGYFSAWSGGRGGALAVLVFLALLVGSGSLGWRDRRLWLPLLALAAGGALILVSGHSQLLEQQISQSLAASADAISSGRLHIWAVSLQRWQESVASMAFGFGPDAFVRLWIVRDIWPSSTAYITHPHNTVIQWLLEFGAVGTIAVLAGLARLAWAALQSLRAAGEFSLPKTASALLIALLVFALTDGLFYHAAPLTMAALLCAYLSVSLGARRGVAPISTAPSPA